MIRVLLNYWHTLKHLSFFQIVYRLFFENFRPSIKLEGISESNKNLGTWINPIVKQHSFIGNFEFVFLNRKETLNFPKDWEADKLEKLWVYNLHYFDYLNSTSAEKGDTEDLILLWIKDNPVGTGMGWDSYPTSLRILNWIKWINRNGSINNSIQESLVLQTRWLAKRIEYHLSANHLLTNAKSLIFSGLFFKGEEADLWLKKGVEIFSSELKEQVLKDGGHYERSPMYQSIIIEDFLDLINAGFYWKDKLEPEFIDILKLKVTDMISWLDSMTHQDGKISFFNDSTLDISPLLQDIKDYSLKLGINPNYSPTKLVKLEESGYYILRNEKAKLLIDIGPLGPNHQPGHGHADTLSFELSIFGNRLIVNTGISTYEVSNRRLYERSTKAHSTVEINEKNSSEVWKSFRVARRVNTEVLCIEEAKTHLLIKGTHDGYFSETGSPQHVRQWYLDENCLKVNDVINGSFNKATARFFLHPSVIVEDVSTLKLPSGQTCYLEFEDCEPLVTDSKWAAGFGCLQSNSCIELPFIKNKLSIKFIWDKT